MIDSLWVVCILRSVLAFRLLDTTASNIVPVCVFLLVEYIISGMDTYCNVCLVTIITSLILATSAEHLVNCQTYNQTGSRAGGDLLEILAKSPGMVA